ncbi:MAG: carboxypeptidase-like regulatory domain-containing protein, partial [Muribaculaceae bacterium]|nr:carboxypeptidase-like regulatory domain-containing protein [Muribaculaceae bacterium]
LNNIPYIKKLKLREVVSFRGYAGHLSNKNNPDCDQSLFRFPEISHSQRLGYTPYMELSVGLDNVLRFFRIDYVWRLNYRNNPGISRSGIRASIHLTF